MLFVQEINNRPETENVLINVKRDAFDLSIGQKLEVNPYERMRVLSGFSDR